VILPPNFLISEIVRSCALSAANCTEDDEQHDRHPHPQLNSRHAFPFRLDSCCHHFTIITIAYPVSRRLLVDKLQARLQFCDVGPAISIRSHAVTTEKSPHAQAPDVARGFGGAMLGSPVRCRRAGPR